jgi:predicted amidophosphoribosyltransferase
LTVLGKVIDVEFRPGDRGRWCVHCDEPFPEGTALCPRCGGELSSAARHRAETRAAARTRMRRVAAAGVGVAAMIGALVIWLFFR